VSRQQGRHQGGEAEPISRHRGEPVSSRGAGPISSRHNPRFRDALALRDAKSRRERGLLLVDGAREIGRALAAGAVLEEAWVARDRVRSQEGRETLVAVEATGAPVVEATPELLARLAYGDRDDGIVAIVATPRTDLDGLVIPKEPLVAVVEGVEKPGNLGAIVRSADGAGVDAVIVADPASDPWNPNAVRASIGTVFTIPLAVCAAEEARAYLVAQGVRVVAADPDGDRPYHEVDLTGSVAIVLGAEAAGLSATWRSDDVARVRIPMRGAADSLNVSASAAVLFYEARRQRGAAPRDRSDPRSGRRSAG
jgi:RNA methyltransferase, TrmH family